MIGPDVVATVRTGVSPVLTRIHTVRNTATTVNRKIFSTHIQLYENMGTYPKPQQSSAMICVLVDGLEVTSVKRMVLQCGQVIRTGSGPTVITTVFWNDILLTSRGMSLAKL